MLIIILYDTYYMMLIIWCLLYNAYNYIIWCL